MRSLDARQASRKLVHAVDRGFLNIRTLAESRFELSWPPQMSLYGRAAAVVIDGRPSSVRQDHGRALERRDGKTTRAERCAGRAAPSARSDAALIRRPRRDRGIGHGQASTNSAAPAAQSRGGAPTAQPPAPIPPSLAPVPVEAANKPAATELTSFPASSGVASEGGPFYTKWWFWGTVGVVAAGAVTAYLLATHSGTQNACSEGALPCDPIK